MSNLEPAALFHSLSDRSRLRLLRLLGREELNVQELVRITGLSQSRVSRHLAVLRNQGWLDQRREGTWSWHRAVAPEGFPFGEDLFRHLTDLAEGVAEAEADDRLLSRILTDRRSRARDFFADIAHRWDGIRQEYEHPDIRTGTLAAMVDRGLQVLDIGTGTGAMLPVFASAVGQVVALDNSEAMLERAEALCRAQGLANVRFCNADVADLPFADASFDACHCSMVLHHVARPSQVVAEMARVIRPGGVLTLTAFCRHEQRWMRDELAHQWLGFERAEIEGFLESARLRCESWLVRGRSPADGGEFEPARPGGQRLEWPDVFLATGRRESTTN